MRDSVFKMFISYCILKSISGGVILLYNSANFAWCKCRNNYRKTFRFSFERIIEKFNEYHWRGTQIKVINVNREIFSDELFTIYVQKILLKVCIICTYLFEILKQRYIISFYKKEFELLKS